MKRIILTLTLLAMMHTTMHAAPTLIADSHVLSTELQKTENSVEKALIESHNTTLDAVHYTQSSHTHVSKKEMALTVAGFWAALYLIKKMHPPKSNL